MGQAFGRGILGGFEQLDMASPVPPRVESEITIIEFEALSYALSNRAQESVDQHIPPLVAE